MRLQRRSVTFCRQSVTYEALHAVAFGNRLRRSALGEFLDGPGTVQNVGFGGRTRKHLLNLSLTGFDPELTPMVLAGR